MISRKATGTAVIKKRQVSQWEDLMKKYSEKHKVKCKVGEIEGNLHSQKTKTFLSGSSYEGTFDAIGMRGYGEYTFPHGVMYRGELEDGMFHGIGELVYTAGPEAGSVISGIWVKGVLLEGKVLFNGTLEYEEYDWKYCMIPDRRYAVEYDTDLLPAGQSHLTPDEPPREIPPDFYDTGNGFYSAKTKVVYKYDNIVDVDRAPSVREHKWILDNCRKKPVGYMGPRPDFYETWLEPTLEPTPLPDPLVGFKKKTKYRSAFDIENVNPLDRPAFYDSSTLDFKRAGSKTVYVVQISIQRHSILTLDRNTGSMGIGLLTCFLFYSLPHKMKSCRRHFPEHPIIIKENPCRCQWLCLLKQFNQTHLEKKCKVKDLSRPSYKCQTFSTGSSYDGEWHAGYTMHGHGVYTFPNGVIYEGEFKHGFMHGEGELRYQTSTGKAVIRGLWNNGTMTEKTIIFDETLEYDEHAWNYCKMPDRRFSKEYNEGLQSGRNSFLTPDQPSREVPEGYSDTEDGFYHLKSKMIYHHDDLAVAVRCPSLPERNWILQNCRTSENNIYQGPRPELYEKYVEPTARLDPVPPPRLPKHTFSTRHEKVKGRHSNTNWWYPPELQTEDSSLTELQ